MPTTASANLTCLCGLISLPGTHLSDSTFPLRSHVCHCNPCRYATGSLLPTYAALKGGPPASVRQNLTAYQFGPLVVRYFCGRCGSHCFGEHPQAKQEEWYCTAGIIEVDEKDRGEVKDIIELTEHPYVDDCGDGGVVPVFLPLTTGGENAIYGAKSGSQKLSAQDLEARVQAARQCPAPGPDDILEARCHCGGVDLRIKRADYASEPEGVKTLMSSSDPHKYLARFCACRSCRLSMGFSISPWTYVAISSVINPHTSQPVLFGTEAEQEHANKGLNLKHYESSDGVWRSFCGGCGASVFYYTNDQSRSDVVDVAVGLLRARSGSLARDWVRWADGEVSHAGECTDQSQVEHLQQYGRIE